MVVATQPWDGFLPEDGQVLTVEAQRELAGRSVLITGAGGFLGSALARALATVPVRRLVLLDISEYGLYRLEQDLNTLEAGPEASYIVGSICDGSLLRAIFAADVPEIVFHAAALKHVPLMESNVIAAARTNVLGTELLLQAAGHYGAKRFVLLSTDKAVEPISVMGATKRIAEHLVLAAAEKHSRGGRFIAVRLCNVLGSTGSVAPLFVRQIAQGGPVTVTHHDATRYFVSRETAVRCLLHAAATGSENSLLIPNVEASSRIDDLARYLIERCSAPAIDIKVIYTGLRAADRIHERFLSKDENVRSDGLVERLLAVEGRHPDNQLLEEAMSGIRIGVSTRDIDLVLRSLGLVGREYKDRSASHRSTEVCS